MIPQIPQALKDIEAMLHTPELKWRTEPIEDGLMMYTTEGFHPWKVQVFASKEGSAATAVNLSQFAVMKLTPELSELALKKARESLS